MFKRDSIPPWFRGPFGSARVVLCLVALGGVFALVVAAVDHFTVTDQQSRYVKVPCYMDYATVTREAGRDERNLPGWQYEPTVRYRYEVNGEEFESTVVSSRVKPLSSQAASDRFLEKFGPGANAECYIDPDRPWRAMLVLPENTGAQRTARIGGVILGLALAGLFAVQVLANTDTALPKRKPRAPGWGAIDSGPNDPLAKTRAMLRERLES